MLLGIISAALATAAIDPRADYPTQAVLSAFEVACSNAGNPNANVADLLDAGWERLSRNSVNPMSRMIGELSSGIGSLDSSTTYGEQFRKVVAGRTLYALLSQTHYGGSMEGLDHNCSVVDFEAQRPLSEDEVEIWSGREPNAVREDDKVRILRFEPGLQAGNENTQSSFNIFFVPATVTEYRSEIGLHLSATVYEVN